MKPQRLSLQAFGPFAERQEVDFTQLPAGSLFLIYGPTGAGKTSILDGICFALYGQTSGGERSGKEMRSHHAADITPTEVEFEFELGARRYRVKRLPEQERTAQRGKGDLVKVPAKAELHELAGGEWKVLATRAGDVNQRLVDLLGFEADQFRQVIMLPQGDFRRLLTAESKDREKILETLFATETYKRVQDKLKEAANALAVGAREAEARQATLLEQAGAGSVDALRQRLSEATANAARLQGDEASARQQELAAQAALSAAETLAQKFAERDGASSALTQLQARQAAVDSDRQALGQALKAQRVAPASAALVDAGREHRRAAQAEADADKRRQQAAELAQKAAAALAGEVAKAPEREAAQREVIRFDGQKAAVAKLAEAESDAAAKAGAGAAAGKALVDADADLKALAGQGSVLQQQIEQLAPRAAQVDAARLRLEQCTTRETAVRVIATKDAERVQLAAAESRARQALVAAQGGLEQARHAQQQVDDAWRQGQAAVLAAHLVAGEACPVCGSAEHPQPAARAHDVPDEAALKAAGGAVRQAEAAREAAQAKHQKTQQALTGKDAELATLRAGLGGEAMPTIEALVTQVAGLKAELAAASAAVVALAEARQQFNGLAARIETATARVDAAKLAANAAATAAGAAQGVLRERLAAVPEALRPPGALERATAAAQATSVRLEQALHAAQAAGTEASRREAAADATLAASRAQREATQRRLAEADAAFAAALDKNAFANADDWQAAHRADAEIEAATLRIKSFDDALAAARERLARAEGAVAGQTNPELEALKAALHGVRATVDAVVRQRADTQARIEADGATLRRLDEIAGTLGDIGERYRIVGKLAEVANGDNSRNLTFQRYVLAALLDDVLRQASVRLKAMSRGRYALQRRDDVADGRKAAGLDLEVFDDYTGRARPANTLSGGEGFMAALSLALGLSDVVQSYAGGIQLDTLFIDEGFGSLDPESLDMALKALIDLQQKGRMVGIISHVDELKQQIDVGIEVSAVGKGSAVRVGATATGARSRPAMPSGT